MEKEREFVELVEFAVKCGGREAEEFRCVKALSRLRNFPVGNRVFMSTDVGRLVSSLTSHRNKNIRYVASLILTNWKRQLYSQPKSKKAIAISKPANLVTAPAKPLHHLKDSCKANVDQPQKPIKKPGSIPSCSDPSRNKVREEVLEALCMVFGESKGERRRELKSCDPVGVAVSLESELYRRWGASNGKRSDKYRSLLWNMKDPKNPDYRRKILMGEMKANRVAMFDAVDMAIPISRKARTTVWH